MAELNVHAVKEEVFGKASWRSLIDYGIVVAFLILFTLLAILSDAFLTKTNLLNVIEASAVVGIVAVAATLVIIAGEFDLSVGAIFAVAAVISAEVAIAVNPIAGVVTGIAAGAVLGACNGMLITAGRVFSFIATIATALVFRGIALIITGGHRLSPKDEGFTTLGRETFVSVKYSVWIFIGFALVLGFVLARTAFGRYVYATGSNRLVARLSGVPSSYVRFAVFILSGIAAAVAGVIVASRSGQGSAELGLGFELSVIAAVAIGGTSIRGGQGAVWRTVIGVVFLSLIGNGLILAEVPLHYRRLTEGLIILLAVALGRARS